MEPNQCRMARAGLDLTTRQLAELADVNPNTITNFEKGRGVNVNTVKAIKQALLNTGKIKFEQGGVIPND